MHTVFKGVEQALTQDRLFITVQIKDRVCVLRIFLKNIGRVVKTPPVLFCFAFSSDFCVSFPCYLLTYAVSFTAFVFTTFCLTRRLF
jgi:hypothetical protein